MRIVVLTTGTNNVPPITDPLKDIGTVETIVYDAMTHTEHETSLLPLIDKANPDWVLHVGALPHHHGKPVPTTQQLASIGNKYKMAHLCFDGAEPVWWPVLQDYYDNASFALQISIDGTRTGPIGDRGLTTLCPVNPLNYLSPPWSERCINMGFRGGTHGGRNEIIKPLADTGILTYSPRSIDEEHTHYARFLSMCKVALNIAVSGGPSGKLHVKARTLEAAASGCLLLETKDSPLRNWFTPGVDYLEYAFHEGAAIQYEWASANQQEAEQMAQRLHKKVTERHNPKVFWSQVMERLGFGKAIMSAPEQPYVPWHIHTPETPMYAAEPIMVGVHDIHNLVAYRDKVYVIPQHLGPLDIAQVQWQTHPAIKPCASAAIAWDTVNRM